MPTVTQIVPFPLKVDEIRRAPADAPPAPAHVPPELVLDTRFAAGTMPNDLAEPYSPAALLLDPAFPRIHFYSWPSSGNPWGAWVVAHYEDIQRLYEDNETFSTEGVAQFQALAGETFATIPLGLDPPDHARFRRFLNPWLTPVALKSRVDSVRVIIAGMIEEFATKGEVDIAYGFGRVFPVRIFMDLMNFPMSMFEQFLAWEWQILHEPELAAKAKAVTEVLAWLRGFMAEKRANPDEHLGSYIVNAPIEGEPIGDDQRLGMLWMLWLGGLDTVASTVSQMFRRLALDQDLQARLRAEPELLSSAVEEFLRTQPLVNSGRKVKRDFEWHGVQIRAGDWVTAFNTAGNFDPKQFSCPHAFDPARPANRHFTLAGGVHLCLGAHLARRELRILLDEWFRRIPQPFRVKQGADTTVVPGLLSIRNLPIVWDPA